MNEEKVKQLYWTQIKWEKKLLQPIQYDGTPGLLQKKLRMYRTQRKRVFLEDKNLIRIRMYHERSKVTDCGEDEAACWFTRLRTDRDFLFEADVEISAFLSASGPSNREAFGIFIRDTMERDACTGLYYSNMAALGGYFGRYNFYGRDGIRTDDISSVQNFTLYQRVNRPEGAFAGVPLRYAAREDSPARVHLTLIRKGDSVLAEMKDCAGNNLLSIDRNGEEGELLLQDNLKLDRKYAVVFLPEAFQLRSRKYLYVGFLAARTDITVYKNSVRLRYLTERDERELTPALQHEKRITARKPQEIENQRQMKLSVREPVCFTAPEGSPSGDGSEERPLDLQSAVTLCSPGGEVRMKPGRYLLEESVVIAKGDSGQRGAVKRLSGERSGERKVILDFGKTANSLTLLGDFWTVEGIDVTSGYGIRIEGSHNRIRDCRTYGNLETGILIRHHDNASPTIEWPCYNLIENCASFENRDASECNADGFACKVAAGEGNVFRNCVAWLNTDDGFDLFSKNRQIGAVTLEGCCSYLNGYCLDEKGNLLKTAGNGNGFKLGGSGIRVEHHAIRCEAGGNRHNGFTSNSNPYLNMRECRAYNNRNKNIRYYFYFGRLFSTIRHSSRTIDQCDFSDTDTFDAAELLKKLRERYLFPDLPETEKNRSEV